MTPGPIPAGASDRLVQSVMAARLLTALDAPTADILLACNLEIGARIIADNWLSVRYTDATGTSRSLRDVIVARDAGSQLNHQILRDDSPTIEVVLPNPRPLTIRFAEVAQPLFEPPQDPDNPHAPWVQMVRAGLSTTVDEGQAHILALLNHLREAMTGPTEGIADTWSNQATQAMAAYEALVVPGRAVALVLAVERLVASVGEVAATQLHTMTVLGPLTSAGQSPEDVLLANISSMAGGTGDDPILQAAQDLLERGKAEAEAALDSVSHEEFATLLRRAVPWLYGSALILRSSAGDSEAAQHAEEWLVRILTALLVTFWDIDGSTTRFYRDIVAEGIAKGADADALVHDLVEVRFFFRRAQADVLAGRVDAPS